MKTFEVRQFQEALEIGDDEEIVGFREGKRRGWREALVRVPDREEFYCGYELGDGDECQRQVDGPDEYCWQHSTEEETDG